MTNINIIKYRDINYNGFQTRLFAKIIVVLFVLISGCGSPFDLVNGIPEPPIEKYIGHSENRIAINLGTGIPLHFVEGNSSSDSTPLFIGRSLGSSAISFTNAGVSLILSKDEANNSPSAKVDIDFLNSYSIPDLHGLGSTEGVIYLFSGMKATYLELNVPHFTSIEYGKLYEGVTLQYVANGRILKSTYTLTSGLAAEQIGWRYENVNSVLEEDKTGIVKLSVNSSDKSRGIILGKPVAVQEGRNIEIKYKIDNGIFGFKIADYDPTQPIIITTELMYSRHFDDYDMRKAVDGTLYVVGGMVSRQLGENGEITEDIFVARLDSTMNKVISTTIIGGNGDDKAFGISLAGDGTIYVTGSTNSEDFPLVNPLQERLGGDYDAFLLKLSSDGKRLIASTYLGGPSIDAGEAINFNADRTVCIAGKAGSMFPYIRHKLANYTTLFPTSTLEGKQPERFYFFGQLTTNLDKLEILDHFTAPALTRPIIMWNDGHHRPVIGINFIGSMSGCSIPKSYQIAYYQNPAFAADPFIDYNVPPNFNCWETGWGYHALRWKALNAPTYVYNPGSAVNVPLGFVNSGDELLLNSAESSNAFFPLDPPGYWQVNTHNTVEKLALGAAFYMSRFGSPVYVNAIKANDFIYGTYYYNMAIEKVTYCVIDPNNIFTNSPSQQLHSLCNFNNVLPGQLTVSCANQGQFSYQIDELGVSLWDLPFVCHLQNQVRNATFPNWNDWYIPGVYIGDPPIEEAYLAPIFQDAADQLRNWFVTDCNLTGRVHKAGNISAPLRFNCIVPSTSIQQ